MSQDTSLPNSARSTDTDGARTFKPSISSIREHIARQRADRILDQFAERFTEDNYFPEGGDGLLFAMLTWLPQWPADTGIVIQDDEGDLVASYLQGNNWEAVEHTITFVQRHDGTWSTPGATQTYSTESLFQVLFSQLSKSQIGRYAGDLSVESRIAMLREQISRSARSERALLFEALMADSHISKSESPDAELNPYLPFWAPSPEEWPLSLSTLHVLNPHLPVERLMALLDAVPLTQTEEKALVRDQIMPDAFDEALERSRLEWSNYRAIDGLLHTRVYGEKSDTMARFYAGRLLTARLGRGLLVTHYSEHKYRPPGQGDPVVLVYGEKGLYGRGDEDVVRVRPAGTDTDSFYLAIISQLQAHERTSLGLASDVDVSGLRSAVARLAIDDNGGWFAVGVKGDFLPDWLKRASPADKLAWRDAMLALLEARASGSSEVKGYGEPRQIRDYAREKLSERLRIDHGLMLEPDEVIVVTRHTQIVGIVVTPGLNIGGGEAVHTTQEHSLTDLSLSNIAFTNVNFQTTATVQNAEGEPIGVLTASYIYDLIRDLDVGAAYTALLKVRLLTSAEGIWRKERFAHVMQAQMRVDAFEAKIAGDFLTAGQSSVDQADLGYQWVKAILDNPVDGEKRARVEGHQIQVEKITLSGVPLDGLLIIRPSFTFDSSPLVVYTPWAPDGMCFRKLNNFAELRALLHRPDYRDYLMSLIALQSRAQIESLLGSGWRFIDIETEVYSRNFFEGAYEEKVARVLESVDVQTTTTTEKNWQSAWDVISIAAEVALNFLPVKIVLPIAALRSLYVISQGIHKAVTGKSGDAAGYFIEAAVLLIDMLLLSAASKVKPGKIKPFIDRQTGVLNFDARPALPQMPERLTLRTDGFFNGIHEQVSGGVSSFYLVRSGKAYPVVADHKNKVWRMVDLRNPDAPGKTPMFPDEQNVWRYHPPGGAGGEVTFRLDLPTNEVLATMKVLKKKDAHIREAVLACIEKIKADFATNNQCHGFETVGKNAAKELLFTFRLTGIPGSKGAGAWRLKVRHPADNRGVLVLEEIMETHKFKFG
ncbi:dermonecrotic toxin domain-containing protein [Pseudomonas sp. ICMP 561]|uniref:dermonecrotic toxin domain-containing protein n=1 Tax=Pseudomonas sp. ICMP 561 TaxID=1718918 RepID=UPI000C06FE07|nr:DUF6543 domain-containing protein [Pseudomonas sp. ICMP 561]PHN31541.1 hypothetical protein AO242_14795 [Pseudomonas sp. ICMP 561]